MRVIMAVALATMLAGCSTDGTSLGKVGGRPSLMIATTLSDARGNALGTATLTQMADGVAIAADVRGLPAGDYAMHLHAVGRCDGPDFASAGPHFNPAGRQHGRDNPMGSHAGDLPNITVGADGRGRLTAEVAGLRLADGAAPLLDADGAAVLLHARPDDYRTDPAGNAGARIACGMLSKGK